MLKCFCDKSVMDTKTHIVNKLFQDERPLFKSHDLHLDSCTFENGESPLKECYNISINKCTFSYKYPIWYSHNIEVSNSKWKKMARAGVWYTDHISLKNCHISAPKNFRRCNDIELYKVKFTDAEETLWECNNIILDDVLVKGEYFGMNSKNIKANNLIINGSYCFDGCENVEIHNAKLITKDAFWNSQNIIVYDSYISGEYIGWNSKNITFINCTIESLQGLCYIENLVLKDCTLMNTTLAFEYSSVNATLHGTIDSILNPKSGVIVADHIKELIIQKDKIDPSQTRIICPNIDSYPDEPSFKR